MQESGETSQLPIQIVIGASQQEEPSIHGYFTQVDGSPSINQPDKKVGELLLIQKEGPERDIHYDVIVSLGPPDEISAEMVRRAGGALSRWLADKQVRSANLHIDALLELPVQNPLAALCEGLLLGSYKFQRYKGKKDHTESLSLYLVSDRDLDDHKEEVEQAVVTSRLVNLARDLGHEPGNMINPVTLAERALALTAPTLIKCTVLDENHLHKLGAGGILNVGKGSQTPPRMILLEYPGAENSTEAQPVVLVGKAITFDTGGYTLKDKSGILGMKYDKSGGLAVLAILLAAAELKLRIPLVGIIGAAENMISAQAYRPDDIITMLSGKTVEIVSTDAEGRLVLADCLTYAQNHYQPRLILDLATLTGGIVVALGRVRAGLMSNDDKLADALLASGERTFERLWRMPLDSDYAQLMQADDADLKNSGGREGHPVLASAFLYQFVDPQIPWAHLDIAGVAETEKVLPYSPKGATGFGIRLALDFLMQMQLAEGFR